MFFYIWSLCKYLQIYKMFFKRIYIYFNLEFLFYLFCIVFDSKVYWAGRLTLLSLSLSAIIIAKGVKDAHGGKVNPPVFDMTTYLRKMNMWTSPAPCPNDSAHFTTLCHFTCRPSAGSDLISIHKARRTAPRSTKRVLEKIISV